MAKVGTIYSIMLTAVTCIYSFVSYVSSAVYDTFILPCVEYVSDFISSLVETVSTAKNYTGAKLSNFSGASKAWMYDMFSRWRVDPQSNLCIQ